MLGRLLTTKGQTLYLPCGVQAWQVQLQLADQLGSMPLVCLTSQTLSHPPLPIHVTFNRNHSEDLRRWLLVQESELFRFRLELLSKASIAEFLRLNDIHYTPVSPEERAELAPMLARAGFRLTLEDVESEQYFQVRNQGRGGGSLGRGQLRP